MCGPNKSFLLLCVVAIITFCSFAVVTREKDEGIVSLEPIVLSLQEAAWDAVNFKQTKTYMQDSLNFICACSSEFLGDFVMDEDSFGGISMLIESKWNQVENKFSVREIWNRLWCYVMDSFITS